MTVTLEQAQTSLADLIDRLADGEPVVITRGHQAVAELRSVGTAPPAAATARPAFGSCRGMLTILSDDDDHLADFAEYMP